MTLGFTWPQLTSGSDGIKLVLIKQDEKYEMDK